MGSDDQVVIGETLQGEFAVRGVEKGPVHLRILFNDGEDPNLLADRLISDESLQEAFALAGSEFSPERMQVFSGILEYWLPQQWYEKKPPAPEALGRVVTTLLDSASSWTSPWDQLCWCCRQKPASLSYEANDIQRLCPECKTFLAESARRREKLDEAEAGGADEGGITLPDEVSPRQMLAESRRLEAALESDPGGYWRGLLAWVALGQAAMALGVLFMAVVVGLSVGLCGWLIWGGKAIALWLFLKVLLSKGLKLILIGGVAIAALWSSLVSWLRLPASDQLEGVTLDRQRAPQLFAWLDRLADDIHAPRPDLFLVDTSVNAVAAERKLGRGKYVKVVGVGIPVLETTDLEEFRSIMAHELAHLRHDDPKSLFIYRAVQAWSRIAHSAQGEDGFASFVSFARWYIPKFMLRAQVFIRAQERAADAGARDIVDPEIQARELVKLQVVSRLWNEAFAKVIRKLIKEDKQDDLVALTLEEIENTPPEQVQRAYQAALEDPPSWLDTHPTLSEQFSILGLEPPPQAILTLHPEQPASSLVDAYEQVREEALKPLSRRRQVNLAEARRWSEGRRRNLERLTGLLSENDNNCLRAHLAKQLNHEDQDHQALELYAQVLEEEPSHHEALNGWLGLLSYHHRWKEAADIAERYLSPTPEQISLLLTAVDIYVEADRHQKVVEVIEFLLEHEPPMALREHLEEQLEKARKVSEPGS